MATENEPAKLLLPYLQRADELQKHEPLVAYYCRLYAMERGLKIPQSDRTKTTNSLLVSLMKQLEKDKKSLKLGPDDHLHVEGFASNVFSRADKQDRAERADLNTAKTFYAASIFFEILNQFGELQPDLEEKQKYAVWKAADIRKALKEGRKPLPGPPGGNKDPTEPSSGEYDLDLEPRGSSASFTTMPYPTGVDPAARTPPDQSYNQDKNNVDRQQPTSFSRQTSNISDSPLSPDHNYPPNTFHHQPPPPTSQPPPPTTPPPPPTNNTSEHQHSMYHHQYNPEPSQHFPSQETPPSYSYPNFQSYPSFTESGLPTTPTHYPSFYQSNPNTSPYAPTPAPAPVPQYGNYNGNNEGSVSNVSPPPVKYEYDSSYQPPPESIAEAHKAARFAVGALAFDDVSIAVDYLKKSLELLTNPSASH